MICQLPTLAETVLGPDAIKNLSNLWSSILVAAISAPVSLFLSEIAFEKGMIFRRYFALVSYWFHFKPRARREPVYEWVPIIYHPAASLEERRKYQTRERIYDKIIPRRWYAIFYKPLGGCVYCFSTWIFIAAKFAIIGPSSDLAGLFFTAAGIGYNFIFLDLYYLKIKSEKMKNSSFLFCAILFLLGAIVYRAAAVEVISFELAFVCWFALAVAGLLKSFRNV